MGANPAKAILLALRNFLIKPYGKERESDNRPREPLLTDAGAHLVKYKREFLSLQQRQQMADRPRASSYRFRNVSFILRARLTFHGISGFGRRRLHRGVETSIKEFLGKKKKIFERAVVIEIPGRHFYRAVSIPDL